jgi:hypothetical protein
MQILGSDKIQLLALIHLIWLIGCAGERPAKGPAAYYYPQNGATDYVPDVTIYTPRQTVQPQGMDPFAPNTMAPMPTTRVPVTVPSVPQRAPEYQPLNPVY